MSDSTLPKRQQRQPLHNILLTLPRTSSHLLTQILNLPAQSSIHRHPSDGYFFLGPTVQRFSHHLAGKPISKWTQDEKDSVRDAFQSSYEQVEKFLTEVENLGKGSYVKVHVNWLVEPVSETHFLHGSADIDADELAFTVETPTDDGDAPRNEFNETALPDAFLERWKATFLIKHPALVFPSLLRTSVDNEGLETVLNSEATQKWETTFHWSRALYTFYASLHSQSRATSDPEVQYPIVLDADDILNPTLVAKYANAIGLDAALIRYQWEQASREEVERLSANERRMKDTLLASKGIVKGKTAEGLVLEDEVAKWKTEFGEVLAGRLEGFVRGAMDDYEWLKERRLKG